MSITHVQGRAPRLLDGVDELEVRPFGASGGEVLSAPGRCVVIRQGLYECPVDAGDIDSLAGELPEARDHALERLHAQAGTANGSSNGHAAAAAGIPLESQRDAAARSSSTTSDAREDKRIVEREKLVHDFHAQCRDCDWESTAHNAQPNAKRHARAHGHTVELEHRQVLLYRGGVRP